jgi:hypothetical protein
VAIVVNVTSTWNGRGLRQAVTDVASFKKAAQLAGGGIAGNLQVAGKVAQQVGGNIQRTGRTLTTNVTMPIAALAAGLYKAADAAAKDQQEQVTLQNTLGNVTKATKAQRDSVERWIEAQGRLYGVMDSELRPTIGTLATATGSLTKAQELASLAMDISAARGLDVQSVSKALAKAYQGNTGALSRLIPGISKAALESKNWNTIQAELARTTAGAASKAANTQAGQMQILKVQVSETTEQLGYAFMPVVKQIMQFITSSVIPTVQKWIEKWQSLSPQTQQFILKAAGLLAVLGPTVLIIGKLVSGIGMLISGVSSAISAFQAISAVLMANPWILVIAAVIALAFVIYKNWDKIKAFLVNTWNAIKGAAIKVWTAYKNFIVSVVTAVANFFRSMASTIISVVTTIGKWLWDHSPLVMLYRAMQQYLPTVLAWFQGLPARVSGALSSLVSTLTNLGSNAIRGMVNGVKAVAQELWDAVTDVVLGPVNWVKDKLGIASPSKVTDGYGRALGDGLANGMLAKQRAVYKAAKALHDKALAGMRGENANTRESRNAPNDLADAVDPFGKGDPKGGGGGKSGGASKRKQTMLDAANAALDKFKAKAQAAMDLAKQVADALVSYGSITTLQGDGSFVPNAQGYIQNMQAKLANIKEFGKNLSDLRKLGLNNQSLQEIIAAGPDAGNQIAKALLAEGASAIAQVNTLESQLQAASANVGDTAAVSAYGMTAGQAQGVVNSTVNFAAGSVVVKVGAGTSASDAAEIKKAVASAVKEALAKAAADAKRKRR